jgi:hypothetical protein
MSNVKRERTETTYTVEVPISMLVRATVRVSKDELSSGPRAIVVARAVARDDGYEIAYEDVRRQVEDVLVPNGVLTRAVLDVHGEGR